MIASLVIENDRLTVLSHSGFSSIKANVCVFQVRKLPQIDSFALLLIVSGQMAVRDDAQQQRGDATWLGHQELSLLTGEGRRRHQ